MGGASLLRPVDGLLSGEGSALESGVVPDTICTWIHEVSTRSNSTCTPSNGMYVYCSAQGLREGRGGGEGGEKAYFDAWCE